MKPEITIHEGRASLPACVFIHGLGVSGQIWTAPAAACIMGGLFPFSALFEGYEPRTLYHDLMDAGYTVATWSQSRPAGPARVALGELMKVVAVACRLTESGVILIGHSRGGVIARAAIGAGWTAPCPLLGIVTISSPHQGSTMAKWAEFLRPMASRLNQMLPDKHKGRLADTIRRTLNFIESRGVRELLPGSTFLSSLPSETPQESYYLSMGGTSPALVMVRGLIPLPEGLEKLLPEKVLPEEVRRGLGDGLVSAASSVLPFAKEHLSFPLNHSTILVDPSARKAVMERIALNCVQAHSR